MKRSLLILMFLSVALCGFPAEYSSPYDPGAARLNGSSTVDFAAKNQDLSGYEKINKLGVSRRRDILRTGAILPAGNEMISSASLLLDPPATAKIIVFNLSNSFAADFFVGFNGVNVVSVELADPSSLFSATKDNAGTVNVYVDNANNSLVVQNNWIAAGEYTVYVDHMR